MVVKTLIVLSMVRVPSTICLQDIKDSDDAKNYVCHAVKKKSQRPSYRSLIMIHRMKDALSLVGVAGTIC